MLDDITTNDHPLYFASYAALLFVIHVLSHSFFHPSNVGGKLTDGEVAVNRHRYSNKIAGTVHATVLSFAAVRCALTRGFDLHAEALLDRPPLEHLTVGFMMVYLAYDTAYFFWRFYVLQPSHGVKERWSLGDHTLVVAHHILGFVSWWLIYSGTGGVYWAQLIHVAELSTPILNIRWIMMKEGVRSGPVYLAMSGTFLLLFFFSRIPTTAVLLCYMWIGVDKWPSRTIGYFQFFVTFGFWMINLIWFNAGIQMAIRALTGGSKKKKKV